MSIAKPSNASLAQSALRSRETSTTTGSVAAGFFVAGFENIGDAAVTVDGVEIPAGGAVTIPYVGKPYSQAVDYVATGSELIIIVIW